MLKKIFSKLPDEYQDKYLAENNIMNSHNVLISGIVILIIQLLMFGLYLVKPFSEDSFIMTWYYGFYIICMTLNVLMYVLVKYRVKKHGSSYNKIEMYTYIYIFVLHFWGMGVGIADILQGDYILVYFLSAFFVVVIFEQSFLSILSIIGINFLLFVVQLSYVNNIYNIELAIIEPTFQMLLLLFVIWAYLSNLRKNNFIQKKQLEEVNRELEFLSYYDSLSGLYNRRRWKKLYNIMFQKGQDNCKNIAVFVIDIDYFKQYNDYYGHVEGDNVIVLVSQVLAESVANYEAIVGRYGGDEFIISIFDINNCSIHDVIDLINKKVDALKIEHEYSKIDGKLSLSIGYFQYTPNKSIDAWDMISIADKKLYQEKAKR